MKNKTLVNTESPFNIINMFLKDISWEVSSRDEQL